mmetsp:Transcript_21367/g.70815  ORF Transcript_21367/g.70815 Transcript_21367/m.70815 type:complete len:210 (+) Transcript_21367:339-968(+)
MLRLALEGELVVFCLPEPSVDVSLHCSAIKLFEGFSCLHVLLELLERRPFRPSLHCGSFQPLSYGIRPVRRFRVREYDRFHQLQRCKHSWILKLGEHEGCRTHAVTYSNNLIAISPKLLQDRANILFGNLPVLPVVCICFCSRVSMAREIERDPSEGFTRQLLKLIHKRLPDFFAEARRMAEHEEGKGILTGFNLLIAPVSRTVRSLGG